MNLVHNDSSQPVPPPYSPFIENLQEQRHQSPVNNLSQQTSEPPSTSSNLTDSSDYKREEGGLILLGSDDGMIITRKTGSVSVDKENVFAMSRQDTIEPVFYDACSYRYPIF